MIDARALAEQIHAAIKQSAQVTGEPWVDVIERVLRAHQDAQEQIIDTLTAIDRALGIYGTPISALDEIERLQTQLAACVQERDRLRTREATYHSLISELHGLIDPEDHPDVAARAAAVLLDCENPVCALDNRLREVEAERDRLRGALEQLGQFAKVHTFPESDTEYLDAEQVRQVITAALAALPPTSA